MRATSQEQKDSRKTTIIGTVRKLFQKMDYKSINMELIAKKAGLSKGTVFFYFKTKQELFIAYTRAEINTWHNELDSRLERLIASQGKTSIDSFLDVIADSIRNKTSFFRLISILGSIIEVNIDDETAYAFKVFLYNRMVRTGGLFEKLFDLFQPGDGMRFYQYSFFVAIGLHPMTEPAPVMKRILKNPELHIYTIDFEQTFLNILGILLRGWRK
jgi:AcrR family transcriptional regulator